MKNQIKKRNEIQALRVFTLSKQAIQSLEKIETESMEAKIEDPTIYQLIEGYKKEVDLLCKQYLDHLEVCSEDYIEVKPSLIDGFKLSTESIIKQLKQQISNHPMQKDNAKPLSENSLINLISPDFQA